MWCESLNEDNIHNIGMRFFGCAHFRESNKWMDQAAYGRCKPSLACASGKIKENGLLFEDGYMVVVPLLAFATSEAETG